MTTQDTNAGASHGVDPTEEITAADNPGAGSGNGGGASPAQQHSTGDPTQNGKTEPIGGADGGQANVYKPEGLPEHLVGQSDKDTIDRLQQAYSGARAELAKGKPEIPTPDKYEFKWSDKVKDAGGIAADDEAVAAFAEIAHKHGFVQDQIGAVSEFMDLAIDKGWIEKPFDSGALLEELAPESFRGSAEEKQAKGSERLAAAETWIKQLDAKAHGFDDDMKTELRLMTMSKAGIRVIENFMKSGMNPSATAGNGGSQGDAVTKSMVDARVADPRNDSQDPKFDPAYAQKTREMFKQLYPD